MNNSNDEQKPTETPFFETSERLGSGSPQKARFLDRLEDGIEARLNLGKLLDAQRQESSLIELWLGSKAKKTQTDYRRIVRELTDYLGDGLLRDVTEPYIQQFVDLAIHQSPHTQKQRVAVVKSIFKFLVKKKWIPLNPADDLKSIEAHNKITERYLSEEEVFRMIDRTEEHRNRTVLKVLYGAGLRVSELVSLSWGSVQEREKGEGQLTVVGKRNKKRTVGISCGVLEDLLSLRAKETTDSDPVFISREHGRISVRQVHLIVKDAALRAGISKKVSPHWLRHAYASHALSRGCPLHVLKRDMGHSKLVTLGEYLKARPEDYSGRYLGI